MTDDALDAAVADGRLSRAQAARCRARAAADPKRRSPWFWARALGFVPDASPDAGDAARRWDDDAGHGVGDAPPGADATAFVAAADLSPAARPRPGDALAGWTIEAVLEGLPTWSQYRVRDWQQRSGRMLVWPFVDASEDALAALAASPALPEIVAAGRVDDVAYAVFVAPPSPVRRGGSSRRDRAFAMLCLWEAGLGLRDDAEPEGDALTLWPARQPVLVPRTQASPDMLRGRLRRLLGSEFPADARLDADLRASLGAVESPGGRWSRWLRWGVGLGALVALRLVTGPEQGLGIRAFALSLGVGAKALGWRASGVPSPRAARLERAARHMRLAGALAFVAVGLWGPHGALRLGYAALSLGHLAWRIFWPGQRPTERLAAVLWAWTFVECLFVGLGRSGPN